MKLISESSETAIPSVAGVSAEHDDLARDVYCIFGIPVDAIEMSPVLRHVQMAADNRAPFLISTPNLSFLILSQVDPEFRESLLQSDLCPPDGMPVVWIARFLGLPIKTRTAGSDMFEALRTTTLGRRPLKVFFFGATESVAAAAARKLEESSPSLRCVGSMNPGFGAIEEMSTDQIIDEVNSSGADFFVAALGARKGQLWLMRNGNRLQIPVRAHLGVTIHFQAGTIKRAPRLLRKLGLEWVWRITREPSLWKRYVQDGVSLLWLMVTRVIPLAAYTHPILRHLRRSGHHFSIQKQRIGSTVCVRLSGFAVAGESGRAAACLREALAERTNIELDFSDVRGLDPRFLGLLLMLRKRLKASNLTMRLSGIAPRTERIFRLSGLQYLLQESLFDKPA